MSNPPTLSVEPGIARTVADILRERRLARGLSHAELARSVSPSCQPSDIAALESQRMIMPSWIRLLQLAEALEVSVSELLPSSDRDASRSSDMPSSQPSS